MKFIELVQEENMLIEERYQLAMERIRMIQNEETVAQVYREYFQIVSRFLLQIEELRVLKQEKKWDDFSIDEKKLWNQKLYEDILIEHYKTSYGNPTYASERMGGVLGPILSALYAELRGEIVYVFENRLQLITICNELFIQIYNCFEEAEEPTYEEIREIFYWYASDYSDIYVSERIIEQIDPKRCFAVELLKNISLDSVDYLYDFGEYISENEVKTAEFMQRLPQETIDKMASVYVEGYRKGFVTTGKDLSIKSTVNIRYVLGFERMILKAIELFAEIGLKPTIYRSSVSLVTKRQHMKLGYYGGIANKQFDYDHKDDQAIVMDKKYMERKLEVMKNTYETYKEMAGEFAGPAVVEVFGEEPFTPVRNADAYQLSDKQEKLSVQYNGKSGQLTNQYIKGEERSFTIIAFPIPEIGERFEEIFEEVIRINTLDAAVYEEVQQTIIDALDSGKQVYVKGGNGNRTELTIQLYEIEDRSIQTKFENCVADVNIPVGEVFTSPVLKGTTGVLHVKKVFLNELQYQNLEIALEDGRVSDYNCTNFEDVGQGKKYIKENILHNHETLPLGEFAIGTNTTAYVAAKKYQIEDKFPILIAEKMGPHFALGDTCYSWSEDTRVYNPNGKEIMAKDNEVSILRKEDVSKAYVNCHTDITIPYEELAELSVIGENGDKIMIISDGHFVLKGTEILNEPFKSL